MIFIGLMILLMLALFFHEWMVSTAHEDFRQNIKNTLTGYFIKRRFIVGSRCLGSNWYALKTLVEDKDGVFVFVCRFNDKATYPCFAGEVLSNYIDMIHYVVRTSRPAIITPTFESRNNRMCQYQCFWHFEKGASFEEVLSKYRQDDKNVQAETNNACDKTSVEVSA